jgi:hypothetical protein
VNVYHIILCYLIRETPLLSYTSQGTLKFHIIDVIKCPYIHCWYCDIFLWENDASSMYLFIYYNHMFSTISIFHKGFRPKPLIRSSSMPWAYCQVFRSYNNYWQNIFCDKFQSLVVMLYKIKYNIKDVFLTF